MVLANGDQALAAEPGFHGDPPQGGGRAVIVFRHASDYLPKLVEQQPENGLALAFGPTQALGVVMEDGASGAAVEAAARLMVEFMSGQFDGQGEVGGDRKLGSSALVQGGFEVADAFFHGAVVAREVGRIVQGQHAEAGEDGIHGEMIEG